MARRINTKFVIVLAVSLGVMMAAIASAWYVAKRTTAAADVTRAREAMAAGEFQKAVELYARAMRHGVNAQDVDLIIESCEPHKQIRVTALRDAVLHVQQLVFRMKLAIRRDPDRGTVLQDYMDMQMRMNRVMRGDDGWDGLFRDCDELITQYSGLNIAIKYRGIAQVNRMATAMSNLTDDQRKQAFDDLTTALAMLPDDTEVIAHLARWHVLEASLLDTPGGDHRRMGELHDEAVRLTQESMAGHPDDVRRLMDHTNILIQIGQRRDAAQHLARMVKELGQADVTPYTMIEAVTMLVQFSMKDSLASVDEINPQVLFQATALLKIALERHPGDPSLQVALGRLQVYSRQRDDAMRIFEEVWQAPLNETPLNFVIGRSARVLGGLAYLDLKLTAAVDIKDPDERERQLAEVETQVAAIKGEFGESPALNELKGRVSSARGQWAKASIEFEPLTDMTGGHSIRALLRAAESRARMGEWGAAAENYERVLQLRPDLIDVRRVLATIYMRGQMMEKARKQIGQLLDANANDPETRTLMLEWMAREGDFEKAGRLLKEVDVSDKPDLCRILARLYHRADRTETSIEILRSAFAKSPDNVRVLSWLVYLVPDKAQQMALVEQCRAAGGRSDVLQRLEHYVNGELDLQLELDKWRDGTVGLDEPVLTVIEQYRQLVMDDNLDAADAALTPLEEDDTQYVMALWLLFREAIEAKQWDAAERLITRSVGARGGQGADLSQGRFYMGLLNSARGLDEQAVANFRAALEHRKIFSDGWRLLAQSLLKVQDLDGAIEAYETALSQRPDSVDSLLGLASARDQRGERAEALKLLRDAYEYSRAVYRVVDTCAKYELEHGDPQRAVAMRREVAKENPQNHHNRRALALSLKQTQRGPEAARVLQELIDESGETLENVMVATHVLAEEYGRDTAAKVLIKHLGSKGDEATVEDYLNVARQLMTMGDEERALHTYERARDIEDEQAMPATREMAAQLLRLPGRAAEAAELYGELWHSDTSDVNDGIAYAEALLRTDSLDEAESVLKQLEEAHGRNLRTIILTAQVSGSRGRLEQALQQIDLAIERAPNRAPLLMEKARLITTNRERRFEALPFLDQALALNPSLAEAQLLKARVYASQDEFNVATREYEKYLRLRPRHVEAVNELTMLYRRTSQTNPLQALLARMGQRFPTNALWPRQLAALAAEEKDYDAGASHMQRAFELDRSPQTLGQLVAMQLRAEEPKTALSTLDAEAEMVQATPSLQAARGRALLMTEQNDEAMQVFTDALKQVSDIKQIVQVRDHLVLALEPQAAAQLILKVFEKDMPSWARLAVADLEQKYVGPLAALARLNPLKETIGDRPDTEQIFYYQLYSVAMHLSGDHEQAAALYEKLLALQPQNWAAMNNLARLLLINLDDAKRATTIAKRALQLRPNDALVLDTLGFAHYESGDYEESREALESSYDLQRTGVVCLHLAQTLMKLGETSRAEELLITAKDLARKSRDSETLRDARKQLQDLRKGAAASR